MARSLGDAVQLNSPVVGIHMGSELARVRTRDGEQFESRFVISAMPFSCLRQVELSPAQLRLPVIQKMPYVGTVFVHFSVRGTPFWERDGLPSGMWSDGPLNLFNGLTNPVNGQPQLTAVAVGPKAAAMNALGPDGIGQLVMDELARLRPASRENLELLVVQAWSQEPYALGCRHSWAPGQIRSMAQELWQPHGRLLFAGEHTRRLEVGMEAAMASGERAALQVLEAA